MDPEWLLRTRFSAGAIIHAGEAFYDIPTALAAVSFCEGHDLAVSGMEGVLIDDEGVQPQLEYIANFSRHPGPNWAETLREWDGGAQEVLRQWSKECPALHVTFTVISREEWESEADADGTGVR